MYRVLQYRLTPTQVHREPHVIWRGGRWKEARGQAKSAFYSALEMIMDHKFFGASDYYIDEELFYVILYDETGAETYSIRYEWEEYDDD